MQRTLRASSGAAGLRLLGASFASEQVTEAGGFVTSYRSVIAGAVSMDVPSGIRVLRLSTNGTVRLLAANRVPETYSFAGALVYSYRAMLPGAAAGNGQVAVYPIDVTVLPNLLQSGSPQARSSSGKVLVGAMDVTLLRSLSQSGAATARGGSVGVAVAGAVVAQYRQVLAGQVSFTESVVVAGAFVNTSRAVIPGKPFVGVSGTGWTPVRTMGPMTWQPVKTTR